MQKLKIRKAKDGTYYFFWCKGCQQTHSFHVRNDGKQPTWEFNNDLENPSFIPSLQYDRCHLILTDGIINYCGDCYHQFSGRSIPLEEF